MTIGAERFRCPEALFQPEIIGLELRGVHEVVFDSVMRADIDLRKSLFSNIILSGGSTLFPGYDRRLEREIKQLVPGSTKVKVIAHTERRWAVWKGGEILSTLSIFDGLWVLREEYDHTGPKIVHTKCFS